MLAGPFGAQYSVMETDVLIYAVLVRGVSDVLADGRTVSDGLGIRPRVK
jgi:hypothetical protein